MSNTALDISALSPEERFELIGELWQSLESTPQQISADVLTELRRRSADLDEDIARGEQLGQRWESVKAQLLNKSHGS
jgi:putative addiction module component (TIGR02574 family)